MHGLPPTFDVSPFAGTRLDSITFAEFSVHFHFERGAGRAITVSASSTYSYAIGRIGPVHEDAAAVVASQVMRLVGKTVLRGQARDGSTLALELEDGSTLAFLDDDPAHECYVIDIDGAITAV